MTDESIPSGALKVAELASEAIRQLIACHDEGTCPAIDVANQALAALASPAPQATAKCIGSDPLCPCADGDTCNYAGRNPFPIPAKGALSEKRILELMRVPCDSRGDCYLDQNQRAIFMARAIEAAHGIVVPTLQAAPEDRHD